MATASRRMLEWSWMNVYRTLDWGWHPQDPTVCAWIAVLPNGREVVFDEELWVESPVSVVSNEIKQRSDGMRVVTTFADPTMWDGEKEMGHSLADEFERRGIPLTKAKNDRTAAGFAIQQHLNEKLPDGMPKLVFVEGPHGEGVPTTVRALRAMRIDKKRPGRIADHKLDHLPICIGYFCMAGVPPSVPPKLGALRKWMRAKQEPRRILGGNLVRRHH